MRSRTLIHAFVFTRLVTDVFRQGEMKRQRWEREKARQKPKESKRFQIPGVFQ